MSLQVESIKDVEQYQEMQLEKHDNGYIIENKYIIQKNLW